MNLIALEATRQGEAPRGSAALLGHGPPSPPAEARHACGHVF